MHNVTIEHAGLAAEMLFFPAWDGSPNIACRQAGVAALRQILPRADDRSEALLNLQQRACLLAALRIGDEGLSAAVLALFRHVRYSPAVAEAVRLAEHAAEAKYSDELQQYAAEYLPAIAARNRQNAAAGLLRPAHPPAHAGSLLTPAKSREGNLEVAPDLLLRAGARVRDDGNA